MASGRQTVSPARERMREDVNRDSMGKLQTPENGVDANELAARRKRNSH